MRALLIALALSGCVTAPHYFRDDRGRCHAISEGRIIFDVDCSWMRPS